MAAKSALQLAPSRTNCMAGVSEIAAAKAILIVSKSMGRSLCFILWAGLGGMTTGQPEVPDTCSPRCGVCFLSVHSISQPIAFGIFVQQHTQFGTFIAQLFTMDINNYVPQSEHSETTLLSGNNSLSKQH